MPNKNNTYFNLFIGIAFIIYGCYRLYNHFFVEGVSYPIIRLIIALVFIGSGVYKLYTFFNNKNSEE